MRTTNRVLLVGRVGRDPELKRSSNGTAWATFSVATNRVKKTGDGWVEEADWHQVKVFGKEAEYAGRFVKRGALVSIEGAVHYERWKRNDGGYAVTARIVADKLAMLIPGKVAEAASASEAPTAPAALEVDEAPPAEVVAAETTAEVPMVQQNGAETHTDPNVNEQIPF